MTRHANDTSSRVTYSHKLNPALFGDCFIRLVDHGGLLCRYEDELLRHATHHQLIWLVFGASRRYWLLSSSLLTDGLTPSTSYGLRSCARVWRAFIKVNSASVKPKHFDLPKEFFFLGVDHPVGSSDVEDSSEHILKHFAVTLENGD